MNEQKLCTRATLALILATTWLVAPGCGGDDASGTDAGVTTDSGRVDVDAGPRDAGAMLLADAGFDAAPRADAGSGADASADPLRISPPAPTATGCSVDTVTFTASGGAPPYTWSTSEGGTTNLTVTSATEARWTDGSDNFCGMGGSVTITVTDSAGAMASATIMVLSG